MSRRAAAIVSLLLLAASIALAVVVAVQEFPLGLLALGCLAVAAAMAWWALLRRGVSRIVGGALAGILLASAVALVAVGGRVLADLVIVAGFALALAASRPVFRPHPDLPRAPARARRRPRRGQRPRVREQRLARALRDSGAACPVS